MIDERKNKFAPNTASDRTASVQTKITEASAPDEANSTPAESAKDAPAGVDVQAYIGRQLRAVYDDVAKQPIPERFLALMKQLEGQTSKT